MHLNMKNRANIVLSVFGLCAAVAVGVNFWDLLSTEFAGPTNSKSSAAVELKTIDAVNVTPQYQGPPFVPVEVTASSRYTSLYGPVVELTFQDLDVERCPEYKTKELRASQSSAPKKDVSLNVASSWCIEAKPGQVLQPRILPGELLDYRSDSFLVNDSKVEFVEVELADGRKRAVFAGAVSVCDNDGVCAAAVAVDYAYPSDAMPFRMPLINHADVVRYGRRESSGVPSQLEPISIDSFAEVQAKLGGTLAVGTNSARENSTPKESGEYVAVDEEADLTEDPRKNERKAYFPVFEDEDEALNTPSEERAP